MPGDSGVLVVARVRSTNTTGTRHSPRPPWGREINAELGRVAPRDRETAFVIGTIIARSEATQTPSFRDGPQDQTSDAQLRIGESRDSGFDAEPVIGPRFARTRWHRPGMTESRLLGGARHRARIRALYFLNCS